MSQPIRMKRHTTRPSRCRLTKKPRSASFIPIRATTGLWCHMGGFKPWPLKCELACVLIRWWGPKYCIKDLGRQNTTFTKENNGRQTRTRGKRSQKRGKGCTKLRKAGVWFYYNIAHCTRILVYSMCETQIPCTKYKATWTRCENSVAQFWGGQHSNRVCQSWWLSRARVWKSVLRKARDKTVFY